MERREIIQTATAAMEVYQTRKDRHSNPLAAYRQGFMDGIEWYIKNLQNEKQNYSSKTRAVTNWETTQEMLFIILI